jgi:hypothetical protein
LALVEKAGDAREAQVLVLYAEQEQLELESDGNAKDEIER